MPKTVDNAIMSIIGSMCIYVNCCLMDNHFMGEKPASHNTMD